MTTPQPIRSVEQLCASLTQGHAHSFLYFWGHTGPEDGSISKACFSQWWPAAFEIDGITYQTSEHFMMATKARLFGDQQTCAEILATTHPKDAKELGRKVAGFKEEVWLEKRYQLVVQGNLAKFSQNEALKNFLLQTGDRVLVEASPTDRVWGIGLSVDQPAAKDPAKWQGLNLLGFALMEVRYLLTQA